MTGEAGSEIDHELAMTDVMRHEAGPLRRGCVCRLGKAELAIPRQDSFPGLRETCRILPRCRMGEEIEIEGTIGQSAQIRNPCVSRMG